MGVALWYCPPINSAIYDTLKSLILSLQTLFPESMLLEPHITLTSQLRCETDDDISAILTAANAAVRSIKPRLETSKQIMVNFDSVKIGKKYFEKVRLCCKEDKYLYGIAQVIHELFVLETPDPQISREWVLNSFEPHLSLVYSDVYHVDQALQRVIQQRIEDALGIVLAKEQSMDTKEQCVWRLDQPLEGWSLPGTFKLVRCEGPVQTWQVLGATDV